MPQMNEILTTIINTNTNKNIELEQIMNTIACTPSYRAVNVHSAEGYEKLVKEIKKLIERKVLIPTKNGKDLNSRYPYLPKKYHIAREEQDFENEKIEISKLVKPIDCKYYTDHPEIYSKDREFIYIINSYLKNKTTEVVSINERAYLLFGDEKFFKDRNKDITDGERILRNLKLTYADLNCYTTYEPFFAIPSQEYWNKNNRSVLIVENLDTFWSFHIALFEDRIRPDFDMIIYGEGKKIIRSFMYIEKFSPCNGDKYFYFGDIDAEGISIFQLLKQRYPEYNIDILQWAYELLLEVGKQRKYRKTVKNQKISFDNLEAFCNLLNTTSATLIRKIVENENYIPQEGVNLNIIRKELRKRFES